jgi:hypothetical protein
LVEKDQCGGSDRADPPRERLTRRSALKVGTAPGSVDALREDAAAAYDVPARFLTGTTNTERAKSTAEFKEAVDL